MLNRRLVYDTASPFSLRMRFIKKRN